MLHDLEAAIDEYNKETGAESARVEVVDNQLIVVICTATPLMKRNFSHVSGLWM